MNCLSEETLSAYLDGQAAPVERIQAEMHLAVCGRCRNELDLLAGLRARLHQVHEAPPMPEELRRSLEELRLKIFKNPSENPSPLRGEGRVRVMTRHFPLTSILSHMGRGDSLWAWMSAGLASFACAALALMLWHRAAAAQIEVPANFILAAHERYALMMPLVPRGAMVARLPEEAIEEDAEKP